MATTPLLAGTNASRLTVCTDVAHLTTEKRLQFIDLTDRVRDCVGRSGVVEGLVSVQTRHTTTAVVVNENEPLLLEDMERVLERLVPRGARYGHNDHRKRGASPGEQENGDSHCKAMLLGASETLHVTGGRLHLGEWQSVFLVELDGPRTRTVSITVLGLHHGAAG